MAEEKGRFQVVFPGGEELTGMLGEYAKRRGVTKAEAMAEVVAPAMRRAMEGPADEAIAGHVDAIEASLANVRANVGALAAAYSEAKRQNEGWDAAQKAGLVRDLEALREKYEQTRGELVAAARRAEDAEAEVERLRTENERLSAQVEMLKSLVGKVSESGE